MSLYQRGEDGYPVGAGADLRKSYGPIPDSELFQHQSGYRTEKPAQVHGWEWSVTFGRWRALVTFADGWRGVTWPYVEHPSSKRFPSAAAQAIKEHQAAGKGLRPLLHWDDVDVTDSGILLSALSDHGLQGDTYESEIEDVVSAIVFGAFHQNSLAYRIRDAVAILEGAGYGVAELRWNVSELIALCPMTGKQVLAPRGYWPSRQGAMLSLDAFEDEVQSLIHGIQSSPEWNDSQLGQHIAGYFLLSSSLKI